MTDKPENKLNFEKALHRLEQILEIMNSGKASLNESLVLFEEAEKLIKDCNTLLGEAETKIETLIKTRDGEMALGPDQMPETEEFKMKTNK